MSMRRNLLTTAAAAALVGAMTPGAMAFDQVDWSWTATVDATFDIDVDISALMDVDGLAKVEAGQVHLGNLTTTATSTAINKVSPDVGLVIENDATSVANNQTLFSDRLLLVHAGQFGLGQFDDGIALPNPDGLQDGLAALALGLFLTDGNLFEGSNSFQILGLATMIAAGNGYTTPATIRATANMTDNIGTTVSNSATAMTNNSSWRIEAATPEDGFLVGDLTQVGIANLTATATAMTIDFNGTDPTFSNKATAVGNNLNVSVGSLGVPAP